MKTYSYFAAALVLLSACGTTQKPKEFVPVTEARDRVLERIIAEIPKERFGSLDEEFVMNFITEEEKEIFANNHWVFTVDKPAIVSVMHFKKQKTVPFWLEEDGFTNTGTSPGPLTGHIAGATSRSSMALPVPLCPGTRRDSERTSNYLNTNRYGYRIYQ